MTAQSLSHPDTSLAIHPDWWRGSVIYQIYPRSFQDSTGDGVGDLRGIIARLPYIADLGADVVWISPFFTSPMKDFGYDVSDYCNIDPMFGTLADFDDLMAEANRLGIRVLIDLVLSHSSDQHPWFQESRRSQQNPKSNWYVWADAKPDGSPPNNWLSIFGGSAWAWDSTRCQYYLHNFLASQPDLNFHEPEVQDALLEVTRFWLERGVHGFRLDTINFYVHDQLLRNNPALPPEQRNSTIAPAVNPYNYQDHLFDKNRPENLAFLRRFRSLLDEYNAAAVGEVGDSQRGLDILGEYTSGNDKVQMCYAFEFLSSELPSAHRMADVITYLDRIAPDGWACWAFSNHDVVRHTTRWQLSDAATRLYAALLMCLRGSVCIYQGEELGLPEAEVSFDDLQDPYGIQFWPEFKGRDGCRTPMVWSHASTHGGFSIQKPWLPVAAEHLHLAVDTQEQTPNSVLQYYRHAIALRQSHAALQRGTLDQLSVQGSVLSFVRRYDDEVLFCAFNMGESTCSMTLPSGQWCKLGERLGGGTLQPTGEVELNGWQLLIAQQRV